MSVEKKVAEMDYTNWTAEFLRYLADKIDSGECEIILGKSLAATDSPQYVTHTVVVKLNK